MSKFIYVIKSGTMNAEQVHHNFNYNAYTSSLKKAKIEMANIINGNNGTNVIDKLTDSAFTDLANSVGADIAKLLFDGIKGMTDYIGENGKYKGRIVIEKIQLL